MELFYEDSSYNFGFPINLPKTNKKKDILLLSKQIILFLTNLKKMANFLIDGVKTMVTTALVKKAAGLFGMENSKLTSTIGRFLPVIIGALISKGSSSSGAGGILDLIKGGGYDKAGPDLMDIFGDKSKSDGFLKQGADLLPAILGNNQGGIMDKIMNMGGLSKGLTGTVMQFLLPIVMGKLGSIVSGKNLDASGLSSYLQDQKSSVANMGIGNMFDSNTTSSAPTATEKSGGGFMKFLLPLLLLIGAIWFLTKDGCNKGDTNSTTTTSTEVKTTGHEGHNHGDHEGHDHGSHEGHDHGTATTSNTSTSTASASKGIALNDKGDLIGPDGKVVMMANSWSVNNNGSLIDLAGNELAAAGTYSTTLLDKLKAQYGKLTGTSYSINANKDLIDGTGKVLYKYGDYIEQDGFFKDKNNNKIAPRLSKFSIDFEDVLKKAGDAIGKAGDAIGSTAAKTVESMKSLFGDMISKKEGASANYALSDITFNPENHRITNFSKAEVEGLAAALKANPDSKVSVNNYTADGKSDGENKKLSKTRAEVVHNMLVALGVKNKQISFKGLGNEDPAKAKANKFEIVVK